MEEDFFTILEDTELTAVNAAAAGVKCRQVANGALYGAPVAHRPNEKQVHTVHDAKLEALEDLIEELSGQPLLVLYEFVHDRDRICFHLGGEEIPHLGGGVSAKKSNEIIARFNAGELPLLLGHPASMGHGLNLQGACHHVCFFGITWDRELYDQSIQRVHRQGQKAERTFVYHIVAKNTLDEKVLKVLHRKGKTQNDVLNALKRIRVGRRS
jgi:SNF2 family DNA or RNA helicase